MRIRMILAAAAFLAGTLFAGPRAVAGEAASLTTLEWPPYSGIALPGGGASANVAREAFAASGIELALEFLPWNRAVRTARDNPAFAGYFPEYHAAHIAAEYIFSKRMGDSPLGFIERADNPVSWKKLDDLKGYRIGVVLGYVNTEEFDRMAEAGELFTDKAVDDAANIRKLAAGRIDLAVMDVNVFKYLVQSDPGLAEAGKALRVNPVLLDVRGLYVCFRKGPDAARLVEAFNNGLGRIDAKAIQDASIRDYLGESAKLVSPAVQ